MKYLYNIIKINCYKNESERELNSIVKLIMEYLYVYIFKL